MTQEDVAVLTAPLVVCSKSFTDTETACRRQASADAFHVGWRGSHIRIFRRRFLTALAASRCKACPHACSAMISRKQGRPFASSRRKSSVAAARPRRSSKGGALAERSEE